MVFGGLGEILAPRSRRALVVEAIRDKDEERVVRLVGEADAAEMKSEAVTALGLPLLHAACAANMSRAVEAIAARGASVQATAPDDGPHALAGDRPIHVCARADAHLAAASLIKLGATVTPDVYAVAGPKVRALTEAATPPKQQPSVESLLSENRELRRRLGQLGGPSSSTRRTSREERVLQACSDTARAVASPNTESIRVKRVFDGLCRVDDAAALEALVARVKADETLKLARAHMCGADVYDGASLLHAAASRGRDTVVARLLDEDVGISPSILDTQGRTALHVAAEHGHVSTVALLKRAMADETGSDPVGEAAPVDLSGRTPLAWASNRVNDAAKREALEAALFAEGDAVVLPTPSRKPLSRTNNSWDLGFAVSAAAGWRVDMEDASCAYTPLPAPSYDNASASSLARPSLFAVFDGHGGALCARLAADRVAEAVTNTEAWCAYERALANGDPDQHSPSRFQAALVQGLVDLDKWLAKHPRLALTKRTRRDQSVVYKAEDTSGSTAVVALVTRDHVVVANLGDSGALSLNRAQRRWARGPPRWDASFVTRPHKPTDPTEAQRIEAAGAAVETGYLVHNGVKQATSRSLGDFSFKQKAPNSPDLDHSNGAVSAIADCDFYKRDGLVVSPFGNLLVLACDGVWDVFQDRTADAAAVVADALLADDTNGDRLASAVDGLVAASVKAKTISRDNVTAIIVDVSPPPLDLLPSFRDGDDDDDDEGVLQPTRLFSPGAVAD